MTNAGRRPVTAQDLTRLRGVSDPQISPDGGRVAFVMTTASEERDEYLSNVWVVDVSGEPRRLTTGPTRDTLPRWSPDGRWLAFVSDRGAKKKSQLYAMPADGGEATQLTDLLNGVFGQGGVAWSPDSTRLAFVARVGGWQEPEREEDRGKSRPAHVISTLKYRFEGVGFTHDRRPHIFVVPVAGGPPKQITDGDYPDVWPTWSPDGARIAFVAERHETRRLTEVKSSARVKDAHIPDVAVQAHVLRQSGLDLAGTEVMHLNRACTYPDLSNLFVRADVTEAAKALEQHVPAWIAEQTTMLEGPLPKVSTGPHCRAPYDCPFMARCWPTLPPHHVSTLYAMKLPRAAELDGQGYRLISDLPDDIPLAPIQERQRRAVRENRIIVEPSLADALKAFESPIAFLDFETVGLAIPVWIGCHPYDFVPVQFSCHVQEGDGSGAHHEWLADGPGDPRPILAERLVEACGSVRTIVAYNAAFERACIERLAEAVPGLAPALNGIASRLVDLLPVVRNHIYHPDFGGGFGLKSVLPALVPELSYHDMPIADGETATLELERLLFRGEELTPEAREGLRSGLLRYCRHDTWALVMLRQRLTELARALIDTKNESTTQPPGSNATTREDRYDA